MRTISMRALFLVLCDLCAVMAALMGAHFLSSGQWHIIFMEIPFSSYTVFLFPFLFYIFDLYFPFKYFSPGQTLVDVILSVVIGTILMGSLAYLDKTFAMPRTVFVYVALFLMVFVYLIRIIYDRLFRLKFLDKQTLIIGTGPMAWQILTVIRKTPHTCIDVIGMVSETKNFQRNPKSEVPILGDLSNLLSLIDWYRVKFVILAMDPNEEASETQLLADLFRHKVMISSSIHLYEKLTGEVPHRLLGQHYLIGLIAQVKSRTYLKIKRILDLLLGAGLLVVLSPILLLAVVCLYLSNPQNVFFLQERVGLNGTTFKLIKLRSMMTTSDNRKIITRLGQWLRKFRVDEIPQLINVLKGDMSLIGPRPEIPYFVELCRKNIPFFDMVFAVKPGLTGWAQVKFRHTTSIKDYDHKFRYNLYYIKNVSFTLDMLILLKTVRVVLMGRGQ